tara:strand:+ start:213 stop:446 length:234 start_codon:yes stop_codon:yes gene_type:complete
MELNEKLNATKEDASGLWSELDLLLRSMEMDFAKSLNDVKSAGRRTRKGLKLLSDRALELRKAILAMQKLGDERKKL